MQQHRPAKHTFRLSRYSAAEWLGALAVATVEQVGEEDGAVGLEIAVGDLEFTLYVDGGGGEPSALGKEQGQRLMEQIVAMDDAVRADEISGEDADEELSWVAVSERRATLHYWGTAFNTEWSVHFAPGENGAWVLDPSGSGDAGS